MSEKIIPTWGYRAGEAKVFDLKEGEKLPSGWSDTPVPAEPEPDEAPTKKKGKST